MTGVASTGDSLIHPPIKVGRPKPTLEAAVQETLDRTRRIETRFTAWLESQGFATRAQRPVWCVDGSISIPSMDCSIKDILATVPVGYDFCESTDVEVTHRSCHVMWLYTNKE